MRLSLFRATRWSIPLTLAGVTIPWVRIPPSPFWVIVPQGFADDLRNCVTNRATRRGSLGSHSAFACARQNRPLRFRPCSGGAASLIMGQNDCTTAMRKC